MSESDNNQTRYPDTNSVTVIGRLTQDPELESIGDKATPKATMRLASTNTGNRTLYVDVEVWGKLANSMVDHLSKGRLVAVAGRLERDEWQAKDGSSRQHYYINATNGNVQFLDGPKRDTGQPAPSRDAVGEAVAL